MGKYERPLIKRHCDRDYLHQRHEINFWVPLSDNCGGTNSLYAESSPGLEDFHPFEVKVGEFIKFYGNHCIHYVEQNTTEYTRVSFDFRVIRISDFDNLPVESLTNQGKNPFLPGEYYETCII